MDMPPKAVLEAFETTAEPELLEGGTGRTWRAGHLVLKPLDRIPAEIVWQADVLGSIREDGFRVTRPVPRIVDGWTAWEYVAGHHEPGRWLDIISVGERFHAALAGVPRPDALIDPGVEPWATGDRVAWSAEPFDGLDDVLAPLRPVTEPSGLIHGDLTGNVLFDDELPPAIIDFTPYWRPLEFQSAVVVADALIWESAPPELADAVEPEYLLRALIYRGVTSIVAGTEWRVAIDLARTIAARCA
jgi:uncharacterized protein (TIGR02569 family)